jgi:hypothetical protein
MAEPTVRPGRTIGTVRALWALVLLAAPRRVLAAAGHGDAPNAVAVARVLGGRQALQGLVEISAGTRWRRIGAFVDAAHALTGIGLAAARPRWRRVALADAAIAVSFAVGGLSGGRGGPHPMGGRGAESEG